MAWPFNLHLSQTCLIHPGIHFPVLAKQPLIVHCIWFIKAWWSILQQLPWTDLPTQSKSWLGADKGSSHSNLWLKPRNNEPIHQFLCQSHVKMNKTWNKMMKIISLHTAEEKNWWMFEELIFHVQLISCWVLWISVCTLRETLVPYLSVQYAFLCKSNC